MGGLMGGGSEPQIIQQPAPATALPPRPTVSTAPTSETTDIDLAKKTEAQKQAALKAELESDDSSTPTLLGN